MVEYRESRDSPFWPNLILWVGFALLLAASIVTVLVPELEDEGSPEQQSTGSSQPSESNGPKPQTNAEAQQGASR
jgi:hypothetical protein